MRHCFVSMECAAGYDGWMDVMNTHMNTLTNRLSPGSCPAKVGQLKMSLKKNVLNKKLAFSISSENGKKVKTLQLCWVTGTTILFKLFFIEHTYSLKIFSLDQRYLLTCLIYHTKPSSVTGKPRPSL